MTRLHEGWDYLLYKIYVWGGLVAFVVYFAVVTALGAREIIYLPRTGTAPIAIYSAPITPWMLGILAYWWWVFLFKGNKDLSEFIHQQPETAPEVSALRNWSTLHPAMAVYGGSVDEMLELAKAARRPMLIWYGMSNLLVLWILGSFWGWVFLQDTYRADLIMKVWVGGVLVIIALMLVITPILVGRASKSGEAAYLVPLGLSLATSPSVELRLLDILGGGPAGIPEGAAVLQGSRHGRRVHIETIGKRCLTLVGAETPPFEIHSQAGKLVATEDAPEAVKKVVKGLRKAKRWKGIQVTGGPEGIGVERESRGQNMWLYDLWLAEVLLERLGLAP